LKRVEAEDSHQPTVDSFLIEQTYKANRSSVKQGLTVQNPTDYLRPGKKPQSTDADVRQLGIQVPPYRFRILEHLQTALTAHIKVVATVISRNVGRWRSE
jgi:hypothetical protein